MRRLFPAALVVTFLASGSLALGAEPTKPVEVIRAPKRAAAKKSPVVNDVEQQTSSDSTAKKANELAEKEDALNVREADLRARESEAARKTEEEQKRAESEKKAKAKQQKAAEDLAKKVQGEFGAAADALGGE